jgi:hypothetical protein
MRENLHELANLVRRCRDELVRIGWISRCLEVAPMTLTSKSNPPADRNRAAQDGINVALGSTDIRR